MLVEHSFISDHIDKNGLSEGDEVIFEPFLGRKRSFYLNRTCIDFMTENVQNSYPSNFSKKIDGLGKEKLHIKLRLCDAQGRNLAKKKRFIVEVIQGGPIKLNGSYVLSAYIENGDICEVGHNRLSFRKKRGEEVKDMQDELIFRNKSVVESDLPILIEGETGVGKTSLAAKIHYGSKRRGRFVHLNLSSFSENLIESELFGHTKGAFTGAISDKLGAFRESNGGTLFLDEIDSLPLELQTKLLLFLDSFRARPVGGSSEYNVRTRVIFASGRSLMKMVEKSKMRMDFYFRISNGHTFKLKSLRDNPNLIDSFCESFSLAEKVILSPKLIDFFKTLPWPGNFRQLKGHLDKKVILGQRKKLDFDLLDEKLIEQSSELFSINNDFDECGSLQEVKVAYALKIFFKCEKNYTNAAKKLSISTRSLKLLLKEQF